jgi:hypothetical protein
VGVLGFLLLAMPFIFVSCLSIQGALQLLNISKKKTDAESPSMFPCSCNLASKRRWERVAALAFPVFTYCPVSESGPFNIY